MLAYAKISVFFCLFARIESRTNTALYSAAISVPLAVTSAAVLVLIAVSVFKIGIIIIGLILIVIAKLKLFVGFKLAAIGFSLLGFALGPIGWAVLAVVFFFVAAACFINIAADCYHGFVGAFGRALLWIRRTTDQARERIHPAPKALILIAEFPAVCGLSVYGIWEVMGWFDGPRELTAARAFARILFIAPPAVMLYRAYLRDTTPPGDGGDGIDVPGPIDTTDVMQIASDLV